MPLLCGAILTADATSLLLQPFKGIHSLAENEGAGDLPRSAVRSFVRSFVGLLIPAAAVHHLTRSQAANSSPL